MKRSSCLIETVELPKKTRSNLTSNSIEENSKMYKNTVWYHNLLGAEKTCLKEDKLKKIHYNFEDGKEMVEEYNVDTQVLLRRAWKVKGEIRGEGKWDVEIGDPIPDVNPRSDTGADIIESKDQPILSRRNTKVNIEYRIRNLPYPIETYSISANNEDRFIIVRTTNKKYFKRLQIPEIDRLNLPIEQYKKPQQLLDMEKEWYQELSKVKPGKDIPNDCKTQ